MYLGLYDEDHEGLWMWVSGTVFSTTSTFWKSNAPTKSTTNNCVTLSLVAETAGELHHVRLKLADKPCTIPLNYICEADSLGYY